MAARPAAADQKYDSPEKRRNRIERKQRLVSELDEVSLTLNEVLRGHRHWPDEVADARDLIDVALQKVSRGLRKDYEEAVILDT